MLTNGYLCSVGVQNKITDICTLWWSMCKYTCVGGCDYLHVHVCVVTLNTTPSYFSKVRERGPSTPDVSKAMGCETYAWVSLYIRVLSPFFRFSTRLATVPAAIEDCGIPNQKVSALPWNHRDPIRMLPIRAV